MNWALHLMGLLSILRGQPQEARFRLEQCLRFYHETHQLPNVAAAYASIAECYIAEENFEAAAVTLDKAIEIAKQGHLSTVVVDSYQLQARVALALGDRETGRKALARAHAVALKGNSASDLVKIYTAFRDLDETIGDHPSALKYGKLERELIERYDREGKLRKVDIASIISEIP